MSDTKAKTSDVENTSNDVVTKDEAPPSHQNANYANPSHTGGAGDATDGTSSALKSAGGPALDGSLATPLKTPGKQDGPRHGGGSLHAH